MNVPSVPTFLSHISYTYDNAENRKSRTDKRLNTTLNYTYDNIYQLLTAGHPPGTDGTFSSYDVDPQGLKPRVFGGPSGTTEVVPSRLTAMRYV